MIQNLSVRNFKSIKEIDMDCAKINLFIGEPNTGKSNILEVLGLLSWNGIYRYSLGNAIERASLKDFVRYNSVHNLFYDDLFENTINIKFKKEEELLFKLWFSNQLFHTSLKPVTEKKNVIIMTGTGRDFDDTGNIVCDEQDSIPSSSLYDVDDKKKYPLSFIKYYKFKSLNQFHDSYSDSLLPPFGANLFSVVLAKKHLRKIMSEFFRNFGFQVVMKADEKKI